MPNCMHIPPVRPEMGYLGSVRASSALARRPCRRLAVHDGMHWLTQLLIRRRVLGLTCVQGIQGIDFSAAGVVQGSHIPIGLSIPTSLGSFKAPLAAISLRGLGTSESDTYSTVYV
jgi:hypothetical protein